MISHKIVKEFGGTFEVNSIPDKGSVFSFTIPLINEEEIIEQEQIIKTNNNIMECNSN